MWSNFELHGMPITACSSFWEGARNRRAGLSDTSSGTARTCWESNSSTLIPALWGNRVGPGCHLGTR